MRRRTFLRNLGVGAAGVGLASVAAAHPTPTDDATGDPAPGTPTGDGLLGVLDLPAAHEAVVSPDGHTAYVALGDGFAVVDIESPSDPRRLATQTALLADSADGPMQRVQDLAVSGSRLLVVGPAHPSEGAHGLVVFDVRDRRNPRQVAAFEFDSTVHNCDFDGRFAYLTANGRAANPLVVVDTEREREVGTWSLFDVDARWRDVSPGLRSLHDVTVQDGRAYLAHWDAGTWILDVTDPAAPTLVSKVRGRDPGALAAVDDPGRENRVPPGNDHYVTVDEDATLLGVGSETFGLEDGAGGPSGIELFDVSDPTAPQSLATIDPPPSDDSTRDGVLTTAHNFELVGGRCYASWYLGGLTVHDVSAPSNPREVFAWRDSGRASFWTAQRGADTVVATSTNALGGVDVQPGLYTFSDPPRDGAPGTDATTGTAESQAGDDPAVSGAGGAGFGVGAALSAVALWAWRHRR
ncbi:LVIVD repeat-containing protein [Halomicroarcula sp. GCM10025817]|uniref:LVIVD repeat-containing protein n=1 Tax=Haloarcula TaxID=2237 RepID=UPI0023E7EAA4|nr:hypothetical protein [Halomicroarcula sp. SYNS111]